ncbi:hypothetical protein [Croceicoccus hydrothermalis]|uniref:hypothetical protein n=1 Tax=Croceicoccus hydrothermalis TaxID=2867964 RepID=UPI001EFA7E33|nr:hypothetical protein [Croceicoccus hydrothermalis]
MTDGTGRPHATDGDGDWSALAASIDAWWADAGVDHAFVDDARDWLAEGAASEKPGAPAKDARRPARRPAHADAPPPPRGPAANAALPDRIGGPRADWPETLETFGSWWLTERSLDTGPVARRVPPAGPKRAAVMVLVCEPEAADHEVLLSGSDGAFLDAMLRAMGTTRAATYRASVLPRHTPAADWDAMKAAGLGNLLRHHVALAAPKRMLVFGREALDLLQPSAFAETGVGTVSIDGADIPVMAGYPLSTLAQRAHFKRNWWHRWLAFSHEA